MDAANIIVSRFCERVHPARRQCCRALCIIAWS